MYGMKQVILCGKENEHYEDMGYICLCCAVIVLWVFKADA